MSASGRPWDLVIFDWDGTLADSVSAIVGAMHEAADALKIGRPTDAAVREIIGLGLPEAIQRLFPDLPLARYHALREAYARAYIARNEQILLFGGVRDLLKNLRQQQVQLAVATGKSRAGLDRALGVTGLDDHFVATRCADEGPGKPDPAMTRFLLTRTRVPADRTVLVGDTSHDLEMARRAGVAAIGVSWGAHDASRLREYNPLLVAETMDALSDRLLPGGR